MSNTSIDQYVVVQWDDTIRLLAQQKESRLENTILDKGTITGGTFTANNLAPLEDMSENNVRHGDTEWADAEHSVRIGTMKDFFQALPLDKADIPKLKVNPNGEYMQSLLASWNRRKDKDIFNALLGRSQSKEGEFIELPADQIILDGDTGFTKNKIIFARKLFRKNESDQHNGEELFIAYNSDMLEAVLSDTTLTSSDYLAVRMLQDGDMSGKWLGINWIPYEAVKHEQGITTTAMWAKSAAYKGTGFIEGDIAKRPDKKNLLQTSMAASYGVVRVEEKKVVAIKFKE